MLSGAGFGAMNGRSLRTYDPEHRLELPGGQVVDGIQATQQWETLREGLDAGGEAVRRTLPCWRASG